VPFCFVAMIGFRNSITGETTGDLTQQVHRQTNNIQTNYPQTNQISGLYLFLFGASINGNKICAMLKHLLAVVASHDAREEKAKLLVGVQVEVLRQFQLTTKVSAAKPRHPAIVADWCYTRQGSRLLEIPGGNSAIGASASIVLADGTSRFAH
jgi:hypothetical protein